MTEIGRNLRRLLNESKTFKGNAKRLSLCSGLGESVIGDIIRERSKRPKVENLMRIAAKLGCDVTEIDPTIDPATGLRRGEKPPPVRQGSAIPIRGGDGSTTIGYTARPGSLTGVIDGYALYVTSSDMEFRYDRGWLVYVNPVRPPARGRDVVVHKTDNTATIARFIEQTSHELVLEKLNPRKEMRISLGDVREMHLVVGTDQGG